MTCAHRKVLDETKRWHLLEFDQRSSGTCPKSLKQLACLVNRKWSNFEHDERRKWEAVLLLGWSLYGSLTWVGDLATLAINRCNCVGRTVDVSFYINNFVCVFRSFIDSVFHWSTNTSEQKNTDINICLPYFNFGLLFVVWCCSGLPSIRAKLNGVRARWAKLFTLMIFKWFLECQKGVSDEWHCRRFFVGETSCGSVRQKGVMSGKKVSGA
jgi:hypothetical protein